MVDDHSIQRLNDFTEKIQHLVRIIFPEQWTYHTPTISDNEKLREVIFANPYQNGQISRDTKLKIDRLIEQFYVEHDVRGKFYWNLRDASLISSVSFYIDREYLSDENVFDRKFVKW